MKSTSMISTLRPGGPAAFALLHRAGATSDVVEVLTGEPQRVPALADVPLPPISSGPGPDVLLIIPYRQITERCLACVDDGEPLVAVRIRTRHTVELAEAIRDLPAGPADPGGSFEDTDDEYRDLVRRVIEDNVGGGDGSNFVIRRTWRGRFTGDVREAALAAFGRLLGGEQGAYWTFLVHVDGRTLLGATPECHIRVDDGAATMNPISGTWRYPGGGADEAGLRRFLTDVKETDELAMVVDEELKVMAGLCPGGGRVRGPYLRVMSRLAHTEYRISGRCDSDVREVLRQATPAPTVTGSPVPAACRVIAGTERTGRGYYGGVLALIGQRDGRRTLDSALLIRTADVAASGEVTVGVGATLVRHSDPAAEVAETRAKAEALVAALRGDVAVVAPPPPPRPGRWAGRLLAARNQGLSRFWLGTDGPGPATLPPGRRLLVVDAGDAFAMMIRRIAETLGLAVNVRRWDDDLSGSRDLTVVGPGPGDPRDLADPRIAAVRGLVRDLTLTRRPFLAICLGHQALAAELGMPLTRKGEFTQGVQRRVRWGGQDRRAGFYNSFAATSTRETFRCPLTGDEVIVALEPGTATVHALTKPFARSLQFHPESLLTEDGPELLRQLFNELMIETTNSKETTREYGEMHGPVGAW